MAGAGVLSKVSLSYTGFGGAGKTPVTGAGTAGTLWQLSFFVVAPPGSLGNPNLLCGY